MGFRFRRSIQVLPGLRLNFSKSGIGYSLGAPGYRFTNSATGRQYRTVGLPGTGMYHVKELGTARRRRRSASRPAAPRPSQARAALKRPGLFAPKGEKEMYKSVQAQDFARVEQIIYEFPEYAVLAAAIVGGTRCANGEQRGAELLEWVMLTGQDPCTHPFYRKYMESRIVVYLVPGISASLPMSRDSLGLLLAEHYQQSGNLDTAVDVVEGLTPTTYTAVSLAELYILLERYDEVIELTDELENQDDLTAFLLVARGAALRDKGLYEASRQALREALKSKKRSPEVRHRALLERARTYFEEGKKSAARRDLERIIAEDSDVEGVAEMLDELANEER